MESMMEKLCGTRTEENLRTAFAGKSQARNKYTYYAKKAEEDGMNQIAEIFRITALNEEQHAKIWFKELHDGAVPSTIDNLRVLLFVVRSLGENRGYLLVAVFLRL